MHSRKIQRGLPLFVLFVVGTFALVSLVLLVDGSLSGANNPPSTLLGVAAVDPHDDPEDPNETPVWAIIEGNGRYYIGGNFQEVGGVAQPYLAAIEVATGQVDPLFRPTIAGSTTQVLSLALSPDGASLYVGGKFTSIDGTFRNRLAKLDAVSGDVDLSFNPDASAAVETLVTDGIAVWAGGVFDTIGGATSPHLAKLDATTGAIDPGWSTSTDENVLDIELVGADLYVAGNFGTIGGQITDFLARVNASTGAVDTSWLPVVQQKVQVVGTKPDGSLVYTGSAGSAGNGGNALEAFDATTAAKVWQQVVSGDIQALEATDTLVYGGTHGEFAFLEPKYLLDGTTPNPSFPTNGYVEDITNPNAVKREKFFAVDSSTGALDSWDPDADSVDGVWEMELGPSGLLTGGDFHEILHPTGVTGVGPAIHTPHVAIFPGIGSLDAAPEPLFTVDCAGTACNVDATSATDDVGIVSYAWDFGDGQTASGVAASAVLANSTTHTITLTVDDTSGQSASRQQRVVVGNGGLAITPISNTALNDTNAIFSQQLTAVAQADDVAVAFLSVNDATITATAPAGWVSLGDETTQSLRTFVWYRVLDGADPGTIADFTLSASTKADLAISIFRGVDPAAPIASSDSVAETQFRVGHRAPALTFTGDAVVLRHWAQRSTETSEFFAPPTDATLSTSIGSGSAHVSTVTSLLPTTASDGSAQAVAIAEHHSLSARGWSIALRAQELGPDTTPPVVTVTSPTPGVVPQGLTNITGGVTDDISGVNRMRVVVKRTDVGPALYWNGASWQTAWAWNTPIITTDTWSLDNVDFETGATYTLFLYAWDNEDNRANWQDNPQPTYTTAATDTTPPVVTVTSPTPGVVPQGLTNITGGVTDDISGVNRMRVVVKRTDVGPALYWNGASWQTAWAWNTPIITTDTWSLDNVDFETGATYTLFLYAWDNEDNRANWQDNPQPTYTTAATDTTPPVVTVTSPTPGVVPQGLTNITGGVTDDISGVNRMRVVVKRTDVGPALYWNGASWQTAWAWNTPIITTDTWSLDNVDFETGATYTLFLYAWDNEDNRANWQDNPQPTYTTAATDTTPPVVTVTSPTPGVVPQGLTNITGGVTDDISGVNRMRVVVKRTDVGPALYWNGASWQTAWAWNTPIITTDTWSLDNVDFETGATYTLFLYAWDNEDNRANWQDNPQPTYTT